MLTTQGARSFGRSQRPGAGDAPTRVHSSVSPRLCEQCLFMHIVQTGSTAHRTVAHGRRRAQPGFSMLELLIASVILGLGLIMVATMFPVALNQHRLSAQQIMATQAALGAKRLVRTHLVPHIDPLRKFRAISNNWPTALLGPDPRDLNGNGTQELEGELAVRGPIRWDQPIVLRPNAAFQTGPSKWHLLHFETIVTGEERIGVEPASRYHEPGLSYADAMNGFPGGLGIDRQRPAWFHIADTISPPVRFPTGGPLAGDWAESSFVWYVFYQRPSPDPTSTDLAYYVAVCRVGGGATFAFQDLTRTGARRPQPRVDPRIASTTLLSRLPIPWLVNVRGGPPESQNLFREADRNGDVQRWQNDDEPRLSQLAPRGARLLGQVTGTVYTVIFSPGRGDFGGTSIDVLPQPNFRDTAIWIFPPPVVIVGRTVPLSGPAWSIHPSFGSGPRGRSFPTAPAQAESGRRPTGCREIRAS